jgi:hypothetical protein
MSRPQSNGLRLKRLAVLPISGNKESATRGVQPAFDGMIASACESGVSLEDIIEMARLAQMSDPRAARFLDAWDALGACEHQARGAADAICERLGFAPLELLRIAADTAYRFSMYQAHMIAALSHSRIVEKSIERALTDEGVADRLMLHKAAEFFPTPKGSQTAISIMRERQTDAATQTAPVAAPSPERTIRRLSERFNEMRRDPSNVQES